MPDQSSQSLTAPALGAEAQHACPACCGSRVHIFYEVGNVPASSCLLMDTREAALACPTGDLRIGFCSDCGFIYNTAFDARRTEYSGRYEETQAYSGTFNAFHRDLAERLVERYELSGKKVLEIGCGKGEFLLLLSEIGGVEGVGIDPGVRLDRINPSAQVRFIADFYSPRYSAEAADLVVCKMTLEHIPRVLEFMKVVRQSLAHHQSAQVFFMVPEALRILDECAFEDIYYEHCNYFSPGSLARLFRRAGFEVQKLGREYADQYLTIEARPVAAQSGAVLPEEEPLEALAARVSTFPARIEAMRAHWRSVVEETRAGGKRVALWGSGSKAVAFLTTLGVGDAVDIVTDVNPNRHNHHMPVTGQRIVAPAELRSLKPHTVIVMNRIYREEITAALSAMNLSPQIFCL
jgi:SAM-dependent methyltransferase